MPHIVTVSLSPTSSVRKMTSAPKLQEIISSGFSNIEQGGNDTFYFTRNLKDEVDLVIENTLTLDIDNPVDNHNYISLKMFKVLNPEMAKHIHLSDPMEEIAKANALSDKGFEVEKFLRENLNDDTLLAKIYRRLFGSASGITSQAMFKKLTDTARSEPQKFMYGDGLFTDMQSFELLALLDLAIEKGIIFKDVDGKIKKDKYTYYAKDINDAAFLLESDADFRIYLQRAVEGKVVVAKTDNYSPVLESSDYVELSKQINSKKAIGKHDEDLSGRISIESESDLEVEKTVASAIEQKLLLKSGEKMNTKYQLPNIDGMFSRKELIAHMRKNPAQYLLLKQMVLI